MKIFIVFLFLPLQMLFSQIQLDSTEYFPLQTGDHWEYSSYDLENNTIIFDAITGDTLMPNGKSYKVMKETYSDIGGVRYYFYRKEGNLVLRYTGGYDTSKCKDVEYIEYDFASHDSVIWSICYDSFGAEYRSCIKTYTELHNLLHSPVEIKSFCYVTVSNVDTVWDPMPTIRKDIAKNIGIMFIYGESVNYNLFAAVINGITYGTPVGVKDRIELPQTYSLSQNYPNPFNPSTTINYSLPKAGNVRLTVFNSIGSKVATIVDDYKPAGNYSVQFNGRSLASGIYLYRLEAGDFSAVKKLVLMK